MSDVSAPNFDRDVTYDPYTNSQRNPYSIENLVASHPIFSRLSLMAAQVIERESVLKEYDQY